MKTEHTLIDSATATAGGGTVSGSIDGSKIPDEGDWEFKLYVEGGSNSTDVAIDATKKIQSSTADFSELSVSSVDLSTTNEVYTLDPEEAEQLDLVITNNEASTGTDSVVSAYLVVQES